EFRTGMGYPASAPPWARDGGFMKTLVLPAFGLALAFAVACDKPDTSDTGDTGTGTTGTNTTVDPPAPTYNWDNDGFSISIANMVGSGFDVGFAETGSDGVPWTGED